MTVRPIYLILLAWVAVAAALFIAGRWTLQALHLISSVVAALQGAGWSRVVHGARPGWVWWLLACQQTPPCQATFVSVWLDVVHPWRFLVPGLLLVMAGILRVAADRAAHGPHRQPGAARWSLPRGVAGALRCGADERPAGYAGCIPGLVRTRVLRLPERRRCSHVLLIGGTGAGKTSRYVKPNLASDARDGHSAVVIDVKFPDAREGLADVIPAFAACGRDVQLFAPWHPEVTLRFPLLDGVRTLTDAMDLRDLVVGHTERRGENPFFLNLERKLLAALILGASRDGWRPADDPHRGPATLGRIYRLAAGSAQELQRYFVTHPDAEVRAQVVGLFGLEDERLLPGVMAGLAGRLEMFADPLLDRATTPTDDPCEQVNPAQLGVHPTLLFIALSQTRLAGGRGKLLLQLLVRVLMPPTEWQVWMLRELADLALSDPIRALEVIGPPARYLDGTYLRVACDLLEMAAHRLRDGTFDLEAFSHVVDDAARHVQLSSRTVEAMRDGAPISPSRTPRRASPQPLLARFRPYLAEVAGRYTRLRKVGQRYVGRCPLHEDAHPSFVCYPDGRFFCFGCLRWGDAVDLMSRMEGLSIPQTAARLAQGFGEGHRAPAILRQGKRRPLPRPAGAQSWPAHLSGGGADGAQRPAAGAGLVRLPGLERGAISRPDRAGHAGPGSGPGGRGQRGACRVAAGPARPAGAGAGSGRPVARHPSGGQPPHR
jgi:hypothetical protein